MKDTTIVPNPKMHLNYNPNLVSKVDVENTCSVTMSSEHDVENATVVTRFSEGAAKITAAKNTLMEATTAKIATVCNADENTLMKPTTERTTVVPNADKNT